MNRRKFIQNLTFGAGAAMLAVPMLTNGASATPASPSEDPRIQAFRTRLQARNIHVQIEYLVDGALPILTDPVLGTSVRVPGTPVFTIDDTAQNVLMVHSPDRVFVPMFELSYNPNPAGPVTASWVTQEALKASHVFHEALMERIEALIDAAHKQGHEVNQIYVPIRTNLTVLSAYPDGWSIFTNMGMAALQVDTPTGIQNPWTRVKPNLPLDYYTGKIDTGHGSRNAMPEECLWATKLIQKYIYPA